MKRSDLEHIQDQLTGGNADSPNGHNLVGAVNALLNTYDDADEWGATPANEDWQDAHDDFQWLVAELVNVLAQDVAGSDDALEADDGTTLADLPNAASTAPSSADLPDRPSK